MNNILGVNIPKCWICRKLTAVLNVAIVGGPFVEVCNECLKYGEKVEFCEVDNKMDHYNNIIEVVNIKRKE
jgi:ribosome-binding protein aMBF1 (putative translation factor)